MPSVRLNQHRRTGKSGVASCFHRVCVPGACISVPPCRLTDKKQAHPAYPFCTFFIPVSHRKGTWEQIRRPIPAKSTVKTGTGGKRENPCIYCIRRHRQEMHIPVLKGTDRNGAGNGNKKNPVKSRLPGYFCIYL